MKRLLLFVSLGLVLLGLGAQAPAVAAENPRLNPGEKLVVHAQGCKLKVGKTSYRRIKIKCAASATNDASDQEAGAPEANTIMITLQASEKVTVKDQRCTLGVTQKRPKVVKVSCFKFLKINGAIELDGGGGANGAQISARTADHKSTAQTTTAADGSFSISLESPTVPVQILAQATLTPTGLPTVNNARWQWITQRRATQMEPIVMPNPALTELTITNGSAQAADGSLKLSGLDTTVARVFGKAYDPDENKNVFPGDFTESGRIALNSSGFVWLEAIDTSGNALYTLAQNATVRSRLKPAQWIDLEDIAAGTDRIEIPIYTYNEQTQQWESMADGWLEDGAGTILPEDAQSVILDGTFVGELYATYATSHFSFLNVDYPFIGPWTLSRIDSAKRNNDCLYEAMNLAKVIALSQQGRAAYAKVNQPGADLGVELSDGNGPELKNSADPDPSEPGDEFGAYAGDANGSETEFEINNKLWNGCGDAATTKQKKITTLLMAVTILHETAHWKDDVKKFPDNDGDTDDEEGNQLEKDLFGGIVAQDGGVGNGGDATLDGNPVSDTQLDTWLNPASWPPPSSNASPPEIQEQPPSVSPLQVTLALPKTVFALGEEVPVTVTFKNISNAPIRVMNHVVLEGWPLHFDIIKQQTGERVRFLSPEVHLNLTAGDFATLQPNQTLDLTVNLLRHPASSAPHYQIISSGAYNLTAVYEALWGVERTPSNTLSFTVQPGGSASGKVTDASNGNPISGATIKVLQNNFLLTSATTNSSGDYTIPELPAGVYTFEASAPGYLRNTKPNIQVNAGQNTSVNFTLSPLLTAGEIRLVLTWGEIPADLDSHLWLPAETPYHIYFARRGTTTQCPFANLDVDDTSSFGPETVTLAQRFNGTYVYAIHDYSNGLTPGSNALSLSGAQVQVFDSSGLIATFTVPTNQTGRWWNVLTINGATGALMEINQIVDGDSTGSPQPAPYADTTSGCSSNAPAPLLPKGAP